MVRYDSRLLSRAPRDTHPSHIDLIILDSIFKIVPLQDRIAFVAKKCLQVVVALCLNQFGLRVVSTHAIVCDEHHGGGDAILVKWSL